MQLNDCYQVIKRWKIIDYLIDSIKHISTTFLKV